MRLLPRWIHSADCINNIDRMDISGREPSAGIKKKHTKKCTISTNFLKIVIPSKCYLLDIKYAYLKSAYPF